VKSFCYESFFSLYLISLFHFSGRGWRSRYSNSLRNGYSGDRMPVGARYFVPVQTGPGTYPASSTIRTGFSPGIKRPELGLYHPPASSAEVKERVELYVYSPSGPSWLVMGWIKKTINDNVIVSGLLTAGDSKVGAVWNTAFLGNLSAGLNFDR